MTPRDLSDLASDAPALRAFVAVARSGTAVGAARALGRTQPSVSARLAALETAWSTRPFRRRARGMVLTPEGTRPLPLAELALRALEELNRVAGLPVSAGGELRVRAGDALGRELLPRVMARLVREDPELSVRLVEGAAPRLLDWLRAGDIDVAFVVQPGPLAARDGLAIEPLLESPVDLLLPPGSSPRGRTLPLEILGGRSLVSLHPGSAFRAHLGSALAERGVPFVASVEVGNLSLVRRFVAAGLGVAPVPAVAFARGSSRPAVERRRLTGTPPVRYVVATRSGAPLAEGARRLVEWLRGLGAGRSRGG